MQEWEDIIGGTPLIWCCVERQLKSQNYVILLLLGGRFKCSLPRLLLWKRTNFTMDLYIICTWFLHRSCHEHSCADASIISETPCIFMYN